MPIFSFFHWNRQRGSTLEETGPIIAVQVGIPTALEELLSRQGGPIPAPVSGFALIDTGASASAVHEEIFGNLGVAPIDVMPTHTPRGPGRSLIYPAKVSFPGLGITGYAMDRVLGCELKWRTAEGQDIIMLLGRDLLKHFLMIYNGRSSDITVGY